MRIRALAICLFAVLGILGCTQAPAPTVAEQGSSLSDEPAAGLAALTAEQPTPEMLRAALSGDPAAMRDAIPLAGTCHTATTCPGFASCTNWSGFAACGFVCNAHCCHDRLCNEPDLAGGPIDEQFRVCFNPAGQSCTEWNVQSTFSCGC